MTAAFLNTFARIAVSAAAMAAVLWPLNRQLQAILPAGFLGTLASVILPVATGIAIYFGCARLLNVTEATLLLRRFR